ncbi:FAD-dependent monooxygenase [Kitasatospora sp. MBT63]|uniref:FAD-dependent monooxygenase n=1 Tax=Kitasatospora sp. MBT63 TaxID=1444768 RepID=UPI0009EA879C|nr:FAD-dependent monooxygenase [Kitasatospora sp. MBT63]
MTTRPPAQHPAGHPTDTSSDLQHTAVDEPHHDVDVLVVGAGPVGMLAAAELLRRGVRVRIVDRSPDTTSFPKALLMWPRSLDLLEDLGILAELRRAAVPITAFSYFSERRPLATFRFPGDLTPLCLPQNETERIIRARLTGLGGKVEHGVRLLALEGLDFSGRIDGTSGVTAVLEHAGGRLERFRAPYVIGADGAGSAVRGQIGTGFSGSTYETAFALVDAHIDGELPGDRALYYQSADGALVIVALPDGVFRFFSSLPPGEPVSVERMQRIVDERGPRGVRITEPVVWQSVFRVHARHAADFALGRVFLAGDAAHVHSPAGGQGLNTGLQDAHALAWRIAAHLGGRLTGAALAEYAGERQAVARRVVRDTDAQTRAWLTSGPLRTGLRDAAFRLGDRSGLAERLYGPVMAGRRLAYPVHRADQLPGGRTGCRLAARIPGRVRVGSVFPRAVAVPLAIAGPDADPDRWHLVVTPGPGTDGWVRRAERLAGQRAQLRLVTVQRAALTSHGACGRPGYHLVRPDGHVQAHGHGGDLDRLEDELHTLFGPRPAAGPATGGLL